MQRLLLILIGVLGIAIGVVGYYAYQVYATTDTSGAAPTVTVDNAVPAPANVTAEGTIVPRQDATLAFRLGGRVTGVRAKEGATVKAGDLLATLDDSDLLNQIDQAQAGLEVAQKQLDQQRAGATPAQRQAAQDAVAAAQAKYDEAKKAKAGDPLLKEALAGISNAKSALSQLDPSPEAIAVAQARVDQAQSALIAAQAALQDASLRAPFAGTLAQVNVNVGDFVGPGTPVALLGDLSSLRVDSSDVSDLDIARVKLGQAANVTLDALPGQVFHGTVANISPLATESRGYKVFRVWIDLEEGVQSGLRWGMDAKIEILTEPAGPQE